MKEAEPGTRNTLVHLRGAKPVDVERQPPRSDAEPGPTENLDAEDLFRQYSGWISSFIRGMGVHSETEVDDFVQQVFFTAFRILRDRPGQSFITGPAKPTTWLASITKNVLSDARRMKRRHAIDATLDVNEEPSSASGPLDIAAARHEIHRLQRVLDLEDHDHRAVFVLYELEGKSGAVTAEILGIPVNTVYTRYHAVRRRIIEHYRRLGEAP
jgi:RNA polymerase sigma-70 factor, ECF subfamily